MPRYFFDIIDDGELNIDHVGSDCADDAAAVQEARRCAVEMASEHVCNDALALRIAVSGSNYANIASVSLQMHTATGQLMTHLAMDGQKTKVC